MPYTQILEPGPTTTKRMFSYDEMILASDGTKYYIKYLDNAPPKPQVNTRLVDPAQKQSSPSTNLKQIQGNAMNNVNGNKRMRIEAMPHSISIMNKSYAAATAQSTAITPENFQCGTCSQQFTHRSSLNFHIQRFHSNGNESVNCPCGKRFANKMYMKRHQKQRFEAERVICGREKLAVQVNSKNL